MLSYIKFEVGHRTKSNSVLVFSYFIIYWRIIENSAAILSFGDIVLCNGTWMEKDASNVQCTVPTPDASTEAFKGTPHMNY